MLGQAAPASQLPQPPLPVAGPARAAVPAATASPLLQGISSEFPFPAALAEPLNVDSADFRNRPPSTAGFIDLDYHCHRSSSSFHSPVEWMIRHAAYGLPAMPFAKIAGNLQELLPSKNTTYFTAKPKRPRNWRRFELLAAAAAIITFVGGGLTMANRFVRETPDVHQDVATAAPSSAPAAAAATRSGDSALASPFTAFRKMIAKRAAVELSDSFQAAGMEAWGHVKSLAPGWTRNTNGWVEPGQLAFFKPSMQFTDYRMQFYGQIESRSMDWVVRAKDPKNYYAMKFTYIEQGLRPIIAVVHYPVINGKPGRRSTTPLNVMIHNHEPYHVDVAVKGTHIVTSIEGQEVDRWIEDSVSTGGVGFFAEAGERARIYWIKVAKNEDFLGKVCAYFTGSSPARDTALFSPQAFYREINPNYGAELINSNAYGN